VVILIALEQMETIRKSTIEFLKELKRNNNREWFLAHKSIYTEAKRNFESYIQRFIDEIIEFDPILKGLEAGSCVYRINRDIRFSKDKSPYKTHLGAFIVRGGKQNGDRYAGYYFHVEPGNKSMIAGGAYMPPAPWLASIRERIDEEGQNLEKILASRSFKEHFGDLEGEKLKTAPKGFPKDHKHIELLKMKSFLVVREITEREVMTKDCFRMIVRAANAMKPLNDFLNNY
jgi:uncharacterized protein (TIGR02453 family)